jgi:hypothetical protein
MLDPNNPLTPRANAAEKRILKLDKNLIINGNMEFSQRGTSFSAFTDFRYSLDRFRIEGGGSSTDARLSQSLDVPNSDFEYSAYVRQNGGTIGDGANSDMIQPIESNFIKEYSGKEMTFSFWIKDENLQPETKILIYIYTPNGGDDDYSTGSVGRISSGGGDLQYSQDITSELDGSWKKITYNFTCPDFSVTNKGLAIGLEILKDNIASVVTEGFYTTGWMLTENTQDADIPFKRAGRNYAEELQLCQRYYWRRGTTRVAGRQYGTSDGLVTYFPHPVKMRDIPIIDENGFNNGGSGAVIAYFFPNEDGVCIQLRNAGGASNQPVFGQWDNFSGDAEL